MFAGVCPHPSLWLPRNLKVSVRRNKPLCGVLSPRAGEGVPGARRAACADRGFANLLTFVAILYIGRGYPFSSTAFSFRIV